jgi:UPF0755 protein
MRDRRPAERTSSPTTGRLARSPAERLEPTRASRAYQSRGPDEGGGGTWLRYLNALLTFLALAMLALGSAAYLFNVELDAPGPLEHPKVIVIPKLEGRQEIAERLEKEGAINDRRVFIAGYLWSKFAAWMTNGKPVQLRAGDYEVRANISIRQLVELLSEGRAVSYRVTVPEGLTSQQIVERLKADANLSGDVAATPPEGSLLPDTFVLQRGASRQAIVDSMATGLRRFMEKAWAERKKDLPLKASEEAVVLASLVEKETGRNDERSRVAAVFINRLRHGMRLQSDPTILYGLYGGKGAWGHPIQRHEILQKTTHNTYQIDGLPPTPICNPGRAALEAVLNPADTKELYFVADGSGGHVFSETLKDHNANVQKWRAVEKDLKTSKSAPVGGEPAPLPQSNTVAKARVISVREAKKNAEKKAKSEGGANAPQPGAGEEAEKLPWATQPAQPKSKN